MADTQRTVAAILALLADNTTGDISPQDLRDFAVSWRPSHGQIHVPAAAAAAVTVSNTSTYYEATAPAWTLSSGAHLFDESAGNGRLTYTGAEPIRAFVACSLSMTVAGSNDVIHWRLGLNSTSDPASEVQRKVGTGSDVGAVAVHLLETMTNGDYVSLWVRNATASDNVTVEVASIQVIGMIS
jgi:hypothetical protein